MSDYPQRRLRLNLDLGADDLRHLAEALRTIAIDLELTNREERTVTSGGWSSGYHLELVLTDPEMTGDKYRALLSNRDSPDLVEGIQGVEEGK